MITISLLGEPIRRISPTFSKFKTYDSQKHLIHACKFQVLDQISRFPYMPYPRDVPIEIELNYFFPIPVGKENLFKWGLLEHIDTPDTDNLCKFYLDVLKKTAFEDDRQVNLVHASKNYSDNPRTEIIIMPKIPQISNQVKEVLSIVSPEYLTELAEMLSYIADWNHLNGNGFNKNSYIDYEEVAYLILEFAEKHAEPLKKLNKKFPGLAKVLKERMEAK